MQTKREMQKRKVSYGRKEERREDNVPRQGRKVANRRKEGKAWKSRKLERSKATGLKLRGAPT